MVLRGGPEEMMLWIWCFSKWVSVAMDAGGGWHTHLDQLLDVDWQGVVTWGTLRGGQLLQNGG